MDGWTHGLAGGTPGDGADDWTWGEPLAPTSSGDANEAFSGSRIIGNDLGGDNFDGQYQPDKTNFAQSPAVEVGAYTDVRVQYWRWLNVEDAFFDQGTVYANNSIAWQNFNSDEGNSSALHHTDKEWRFHDVPVSRFVGADGTVQIKYELSSDGGLEFGGWNIDDFCIVANTASVCGDGSITGVETCDDGASNSDEADACRSNCQLAACGDGIIDSGESCDDGNGINDDDCDNTCGFVAGDGSGCGCTVGAADPRPLAGGLMMALMVLGVLLRRRRQ
jgi:MYXO-CTERM domain-containing protein